MGLNWKEEKEKNSNLKAGRLKAIRDTKTWGDSKVSGCILLSEGEVDFVQEIYFKFVPKEC